MKRPQKDRAYSEFDITDLLSKDGASKVDISSKYGFYGNKFSGRTHFIKNFMSSF